MKRKIVALIGIALLLIGALAACSSKSTDSQANDSGSKDGKIQLRVTWWGSQDRHDRTLKAIKLFEKKNPDIKITPEFTGWDGYWDKVATSAAGNNMADVIQMDYAYIGEYVSRGLLEDLDSYVDSGTINLKDVKDNFINSGQIDGKLYGINLGANSPTIAYDPEMFKKAGVEPFKVGYTWEDYAKASRKLKESLGKNGYGIEAVNNSLGWFGIYLREHGYSRYNSDGTGLGYDDDKLLVDYFNYWNDLRKDGTAAPPDVSTTVKGLEDSLIVNKKAPVIWFHSNQLVALESAAERELNLAMFPSTPGGKEGLYLKPSMFFSISSHSKHKEAAAKFIDFFTNDPDANKILAAERGVPISTKIREQLKPTLSKAAQKTFDYVDLVSKHSSKIYPPEPPGASQVNDVFTRIAEQINYGKMTPEDGAKKFRQEAEKILAKNKK